MYQMNIEISINDQFIRQIGAADGMPLEWHFKEEATLNDFRKHLNDTGIEIPENVELKHTP